ncbi:Elongator complex protein 5 [Chaetomidium leptoderma]|uniref:Elongator complex protein 5 n=1 Tax=Chaetomidium leptoderma TaxID=669021 RepID=A0AAN6VRJ1_9PEZI|nr:Elongator complex protein 5 [Chaetomidium leptoderma]
MAPSAQAHKRAHSLLLLEKLLNLRDSASPLTLILDTLEQSAQPLTQEFMRRAKAERAKIVFVSFATIKKPALADILIKGRGKPLKALAAEIASHVTPPRTTASKDAATPPIQKSLILLDTLNPLASSTPHLLPSFFSSIITPSASLVAVYHLDIPALNLASSGEYAPHPLTLLTHLATTVFRVASLRQAVEARRARERSLPEPEWGLREGREGVLVGLGNVGNGNGNGNGSSDDDVVVEMEMRRRSGRAVADKFVLVHRKGGVVVMVMGDHPEFRVSGSSSSSGGAAAAGEGMEATFDLGLTEKQRRDREGVVLPYFDAQIDVGGGEGGRILYDMGREDDFDEEDDEI